MLEPLLNVTTLVDVRWLSHFMQQAETKGVLPAWQELPREAEVTLGALRAYTGVDLPILFLSYPWLDRSHPDPHGTMLQTLAPLLSAVVRYLDKGGGGKDASMGVFIDFMALPQRGYTSGFDPQVDDRTPKQMQRFRAGLSSISTFYAHKHTYTICLDGPLPTSAVNKAGYNKRGWCIFERLLSSLIKNCNCFLQLSKWVVADRNVQSWFEIINMCAAMRAPPMPPDAFTEMMCKGVEREAAAPGSGIRFTCGKDLTDVILPQYSQAFLKLMGEATKLEYASLGWTDQDAETLVVALTYAASREALGKLEKLDLYNNELTDEGAMAIASAVARDEFVAPRLKQIVVTRNNISKRATREALEKATGSVGASAATGVGTLAPSVVGRLKARLATAGGGAASSSSASSSSEGSSNESRGGKRAINAAFAKGVPPENAVTATGRGKGVLVLRIGNTHHDEQATKGPMGGAGRHHWCIYVEPRWAGATGKAGGGGTSAIEWVEFELDPTFRNRFKMVSHATPKGRFEYSTHGWGAFVVSLKVKVAGEATPYAFEHDLCFEGKGAYEDFHREVVRR